jgi:hypothetical protein
MVPPRSLYCARISFSTQVHCRDSCGRPALFTCLSLFLSILLSRSILGSFSFSCVLPLISLCFFTTFLRSASQLQDVFSFAGGCTFTGCERGWGRFHPYHGPPPHPPQQYPSYQLLAYISSSYLKGCVQPSLPLSSPFLRLFFNYGVAIESAKIHDGSFFRSTADCQHFDVLQHQNAPGPNAKSSKNNREA